MLQKEATQAAEKAARTLEEGSGKALHSFKLENEVSSLQFQLNLARSGLGKVLKAQERQLMISGDSASRQELR